MKKILSILTLVAFSAASGFAACGKKVTDEGTVKSIDADKKEITITTADGKAVALILTPTTALKDKAGATAKADALVGKKVKVVSEHKKVDSVSEA